MKKYILKNPEELYSYIRDLFDTDIGLIREITEYLKANNCSLISMQYENEKIYVEVYLIILLSMLRNTNINIYIVELIQDKILVEEDTDLEFKSGTYRGIYYSVNNDCDENTGGYYVEFYKYLENDFKEIDFDNRLDYMVIHVNIEDEIKNPKKYVEEHINNLIKELEQ